MAKQFAYRLALIAFATATLRGVLLGNDFEATLKTSLLATALFYGLGYVIGDLARRVVEEQVQTELVRWRSEHPR